MRTGVDCEKNRMQCECVWAGGVRGRVGLLSASYFMLLCLTWP